MKSSTSLTRESVSQQHSIPELLLWAQLFHSGSASELDYGQLTDGGLFRKIFQEIEGRTIEDIRWCDAADNVKDRLRNWHFLAQNIRSYYLEALQEVIIARPPNIVLLSRRPKSARAHRELEQFLLLLLCAAVRCERRDHFICQIMENLSPDVQAGIMNCITNFTENLISVMSFEKLQSSPSDLSHVIRDAMNQLEEVYLEEIRDLIDQLSTVQTKLTTLQARVRLTSRGRALSLGRVNLHERSVSTISLGDPTRGEVTTSTPKLNYNTAERSNSPRKYAKRFFDGDDEQCHSINDNSCPTPQPQQSFTVSDGPADVLCDENDYMDPAFCPDSFVLEDAESVADVYPDALDCFQLHAEKHHVSVELAETKAKLRRARAEIEDQADQLNELHDQLSETRRELGQVKEERARLADAAHSARHWQDEVDALREAAERVHLLESENAKLKDRMHEVDYYKARCEQLTGDLNALSDEHLKQASQRTDEDAAALRCVSLEQELAKTRARLAEVDLLRSADLDEFQKIREEFGRLKLEQSAREHARPVKQVQRRGLPKSKPLESTVDISDNDASESQTSVSDVVLLPNLSSQLAESVSTRLDRLESDNRRLLEECNFAKQTACEVTDKLADTEARLAEKIRTNQLMTEKLSRIETLATTQSEQIRLLELERSKAETETAKARDTLIRLQQTSDQHIAELSKENNFLTETMTLLRGSMNDHASADDQLARLQKENSVLGEAAQTATSRMARAELELSQLRMRQSRMDEMETLIDSLRVERDKLSASLISTNLEITSLRETCQRQSTLESAIVEVEGECARLRSQLESERNGNVLRGSFESEANRLVEKTAQCDQLQESLKVAADTINKLEAERDKLTERVSELKQQLASKKAVTLDGHDRDPVLDADAEAGDDEDEDGEVDSGNKTGDSTEETSPDQFAHGRSRRKMYTLSSNSNRYRDRRRRTRAGLESEIQRLETESERMEEQYIATKRQLDECGDQLLQKESIISDLKSDLERTVAENQSKEEKIEYLQSELTRLQSLLTSTEKELRRLKNELREVQSDPSSTEAGKELMLRIERLERQLSKSAVAHQGALKQKEAHIEQLEREHSETYEQLSSERKMVLTLRTQLVEEKIKVQQKSSLFDWITNALKQLGVPESRLDELFLTENTDDCAEHLESLIRSHVAKQVKEKDKEIQCLKQQMVIAQLRAPSVTHSSDSRPSADDVCNYGPVGYTASVEKNHRSADNPENLEQLKDCMIQQGTKNNLHEEFQPKDDVKVGDQTGQFVSVQPQLNELIGTNARLQVENTTLHSHVDSLSAQNSKLSNRCVELEAETKRLRSMVESAHAAEANVSADYYHLQKLHERLSQDFESLTRDLKESKETQRRLKNDFFNARTQLEQLQSASEEVRHLKEALESERGNLKGEARQIVLLREDCARLRSQVELITESRDRERMEKVAAIEKVREYRRQLDQTEDRASQINLELETRQNVDKRLQINLAELRSRVQIVTEANNRLEVENRSLMLQLQGLVGQNQELLTSTLETCGKKVTEERALRERLLSLQRQKQHLEDKLMDQYRSISQPKKANRRMNLMQKARAALIKRKDPNTTPPKRATVSGTIRGYGPSNNSEFLQSKDSASTEEGSSPGMIVSPNKRLTPGSVSIYDRHPDELDTGEFQAFLRRLEASSKTDHAHRPKVENTHSQRQSTVPVPSCGGLLNATSNRTATLPSSVISATADVLCRAKYPNGDQANHEQSQRTSKLCRSISSQPIDGNQKHHFPHMSTHGSNLSTNPGRSVPSDQTSAKALDTSNTPGNARSQLKLASQQPLPATERCEKQLREIVTTKSTYDEVGSGCHSRQGSGISRSSSMRSFTSSPRPNSHRANGPDTSAFAASSKNTTNTTISVHRNPSISQPGESEQGALGAEERKIRENVSENSGFRSSECSSNVSSVCRSGSMASNLDCHVPNGRVPFGSRDSNGSRTSDKQPIALEVVGKPRVLLEYGNL
ncbi:girdin [Clonorchis sinensis]|uniref:Girdin n=1 Tax=Clonorchis sinensis TaxID=79923 RepID=H2KPA5_CLOSI|nr:girdin [Clonorchis sinensis]